MKKLFILLGVAAIITVSCKKAHEPEGSTCNDALIRWGGDPAADGVGWYLYIPGDNNTAVFEYPDNMPDVLKTDGLPVHVCYERTNADFVCFCAPPFPKMVHITYIKKR